MADQRLHRILSQRETTKGDDLFGEYDLVADEQRDNLSPVQRVVVLTESFLPKVDGVSKTTYLTIRYLQETGRDVLIFAPDTAVPNVGPSPVITLPSFTIQMASETRVALPIPRIMREIRNFKPDLIHLASPALMAASGMAAGRELNVPVVANYQTDLPGYATHYGTPMLERPIRNWLRYLHNGCHINLVPAQSVGEGLHDEGFRRLRVWGRGVNITRFHPDNATSEMRERLLAGRPDDSLLCVFLGRLANEKRVDLLRKVADIDGIALTVIGDGHQREALEEIFAGTGTHFAGYMFGDELGEALASADVFTFGGPNETFGQVIQEAMASGLPTVVTNQGAIKDLVREGETGMIVEHTEDAFAEAVRYLEANRDHVKQMGRNAREFAETRPWSTIMSELEDYYDEAYRMNQRFERIYGRTTYHHTAMPVSVIASAGVFLIAQVKRK